MARFQTSSVNPDNMRLSSQTRKKIVDNITRTERFFQILPYYLDFFIPPVQIVVSSTIRTDPPHNGGRSVDIVGLDLQYDDGNFYLDFESKAYRDHVRKAVHFLLDDAFSGGNINQIITDLLIWDTRLGSLPMSEYSAPSEYAKLVRTHYNHIHITWR